MTTEPTLPPMRIRIDGECITCNTTACVCPDYTTQDGTMVWISTTNTGGKRCEHCEGKGYV